MDRGGAAIGRRPGRDAAHDHQECAGLILLVLAERLCARLCKIIPELCKRFLGPRKSAAIVSLAALLSRRLTILQARRVLRAAGAALRARRRAVEEVGRT